MNKTDVRGAFREMWETRPARPRDDRQVAGVAAAIARRYDIDPVLVRIGFVVAAFFGVGAALYIAGWIVLPEAQADPAVPESRRRGIFVVGLVIATIASVASISHGRGGFVFPLLAALALLFLLHRSRSDRGLPGTGRVAGLSQTRQAPGADATQWTGTGVPPQSWPPQPAQAGAPSETDDGGATSAVEGISLVKGSAKESPPPDDPKPPSWDPLGAAPFAWDLPEPSPSTQVAPTRRRRPPVTLVTLGLALLAGAGTSVGLLLTGSLAVPTVPVLLGVVLAVLGAGLLVGSFLHAGRGIIPFALLASALTWGVLAAPLDRYTGDGFGDIKAAPTTVAQLQPSYRRSAGDITLDLSGLDLAPAGSNASDVRTSVQVGGGDATVLLPAQADVTFSGDAGLGDVQFDGQKVSGPGAKLSVVDDLGSDGVRAGRLLVIDVQTGAGDVEVRRV
jgi:phage shock protein PspC (stress-responsive transcriptional regulator)